MTLAVPAEVGERVLLAEPDLRAAGRITAMTYAVSGSTATSARIPILASDLSLRTAASAAPTAGSRSGSPGIPSADSAPTTSAGVGQG